MRLLAMLCMKAKKETELGGAGLSLSHFPEHYMLIMARWFIKPAGSLAVMFRQPSALGRGALMASNTAQLEASGSPLADPSSEEGRARPFLWHLYSAFTSAELQLYLHHGRSSVSEARSRDFAMNRAFAIELAVAALRSKWLYLGTRRRPLTEGTAGEMKQTWALQSLHATEISLSGRRKPQDLPFPSPQISFSHLITRRPTWHGVKTLSRTPSNTHTHKKKPVCRKQMPSASLFEVPLTMSSSYHFPMCEEVPANKTSIKLTDKTNYKANRALMCHQS